MKVLDLRLAKVMDTSLTLSVHSTQPGVLIGTAAYMSPEQAEADRPIDAATCGHSASS